MARKYKKSVWGIYPSRLALETAIDGLRENGFLSSDISVAAPIPRPQGARYRRIVPKHREERRQERVQASLIGGAPGWLAGIGAFALPGLGAFIAAGPIMGALAGVGVGGVLGGITGALIGSGIPEYEARRYEGASPKEGFWFRFIAVRPPEILMRRK